MVDIKPVNDYVLVEPYGSPDDDGVTESGLYTPFKAKHRVVGTVRAVGPGRPTKNGDRTEPDFVVGERVLIGVKSGEKLHKNGKEYKLIKSQEIMGAITEELFESMT